MKTLIAALALVCLFDFAPVSAQEDEAEVIRPILKVLSPGAVNGKDPNFGGAAFLTGQWAGTRFLVVLEIIDITGKGINVTDFGEPRFFDTDKNVDLFVSGIEEVGTYTNGQGREVIQIISKVPIENLETGDDWLSPPIAKESIPLELLTEGFSVPMRSLVEAAKFVFVVQDREGVNSAPVKLVVGYTESVYGGPFNKIKKEVDAPQGPSE